MLQMGDAQAQAANLLVHKEDHSVGVTHRSPAPKLKNRWLHMIAYMIFVLFGQSSGTLLGRLYYNKGGKTIWLATLVETIGFPILIPIFLYFRNLPHNLTPTNMPSPFVLTTIYLSLGLLQTTSNLLYSIGLLRLPVSTYSLLSASQLGFNALFSFFLNEQSLTPPVINSIVLLTISSALLMFQSDSEHPGLSKKGYPTGFFCTILASALYSLLLSLEQLSFQKVLKGKTFAKVMNMIVYQSIVATCATTVALFSSGEWRNLKGEMDNFEMGKGCYVVVLVSTTMSWQVFSLGAVGLIHEASSLFSNVVSTFALPIIPVMAVVIFHDEMNSLKVIAILLAVWGFASYLYQHYLDNYKSKSEAENVNGVSELSLVARC